jgi:hypothetical protein
MESSSKGGAAMQRAQVESSMLRSVGYDPSTSVLELEFRNGRLSRYAEVGEETYRELMAAPSKGRYFLDYIDDQYPYARVSAPRRRAKRW